GLPGRRRNRNRPRPRSRAKRAQRSRAGSLRERPVAVHAGFAVDQRDATRPLCSWRSAVCRWGHRRPTLPDVVARDTQPELPESFARSVASLRPVRMRSEIKLAEAPAPQRLAPFALAMTAEVGDPRDDEIASGRFVVLHDPAGQDSWQGCTRIVAYVRAELE